MNPKQSNDPIPPEDTTSTVARRDLIPLPDDARQKQVADALTSYAIERYNLSQSRHPMADAAAGDLIPVCVQTAAWRTKNGRHDDGTQRWASGRFYLQDATHSFLTNHDGIYVFIVYEKHPMGVIPVYERRTYPEVVEQVADEVDWGARKRVKWSDIIPNTGGEV